MKYQIIIIILFLSINAYGNDTLIDYKWYKPNHAVIQYAGDIGLISAGIGFQSRKEHFQYQFTIGYVPKIYIDEKNDLYTINTLFHYTPFFLNIREYKIRVSPVVLSIGSSLSIGEKFTKYHDSNYPQGYYWWPKSVRIIVSFGQAGRIDLSEYSGAIDAIELFSQLTANDFAIYSQSANSILKLKHILHYSCGIKIYF